MSNESYMFIEFIGSDKYLVVPTTLMTDIISTLSSDEKSAVYRKGYAAGDHHFVKDINMVRIGFVKSDVSLFQSEEDFMNFRNATDK